MYGKEVMFMNNFLVQYEHNDAVHQGDRAALSSDCASVVEAINARNWSDPENEIGCDLANLSLVQRAYCKEYLRKVVPVGSIEFVEAVLETCYGIQSIIPQNIPEPLLGHEFCGRKVVPACDAGDISGLMDGFGVNKVFIKSAERAKTDLTGIYTAADLKTNWNPRGERVFVSTLVNFVSEWRIFVFRGRIVDARPYTGNHLVAPDEGGIKKMVEAMGNTLHAYTLDVGVTDGGETVVVEVHNFVACGLYGANIPLGMYRTAYQQEIAFHDKS